VDSQVALWTTGLLVGHQASSYWPNCRPTLCWHSAGAAMWVSPSGGHQATMGSMRTKGGQGGQVSHQWQVKPCMPAAQGLQGAIPVSKSAVQQRHLQMIKSKATEFLAKSPRYMQLTQIDLSMPLSRFRKTTQNLPWAQASLLIQLRMGHVPLQKHLHRIGRANSPKCLACHMRDETVHHYLVVCLAHRGLRGQMEKALQWGMQSVGTLLSNPKAFKHLFRYINVMQCFCSMAGLNHEGQTYQTYVTTQHMAPHYTCNRYPH